jgi:small GTP-binding protein
MEADFTQYLYYFRRVWEIEKYVSDVDNISVKIVILGEPAVGKTSLRLNFIGRGMGSAEEFLMTLGADLSEAKVEISNKITLDAQIWDIAGQENFTPIIGEYLQGAQGAIIVYDMTRSYTFDKITDWLEKLHNANPDLDRNIPFIVVGNKADLDNFYDYDEEKVVSFIEYLNRHRLYSQTDAEHLNTSAKTGYAVKQAFQRLGKIIIRNFIELGESIEGASELFSDIESSAPKSVEPKKVEPVEEERLVRPSERFVQTRDQVSGQEPTPSQPVSRPEPTPSQPVSRPEPTPSQPVSRPEPTPSQPVSRPEPTPSQATPTEERPKPTFQTRVRTGTISRPQPSNPNETRETVPAYQSDDEHLVRPSELLRRRREEQEKREQEGKQ